MDTGDTNDQLREGHGYRSENPHFIFKPWGYINGPNGFEFDPLRIQAVRPVDWSLQDVANRLGKQVTELYLQYGQRHMELIASDAPSDVQLRTDMREWLETTNAQGQAATMQQQPAAG